MSTPSSHARTPEVGDVKIFVPAKDFELSLAFYEALGWKRNWREGGLAELELASARFYLQDYYVKAWAENFMIYLDVRSAGDWHRHVSRVLADRDFAEARVEAPRREPYGALVCYAWDPSGVLLHLAQLVRPGS